MMPAYMFQQGFFLFTVPLILSKLRVLLLESCPPLLKMSFNYLNNNLLWCYNEAVVRKKTTTLMDLCPKNFLLLLSQFFTA